MTSTHRPRATSSLCTAAVLLAVLTVAGCFPLGDPSSAGAAVVNDTDEPLVIGVEGNPPTYTADPGDRRSHMLSGTTGDCTEWVLAATTTDGILVSRLGPPVCDGEVWTITQDELDEARGDTS